MGIINKVLYPTDFSERSLAALPLAVDLVQRYGAELHCLHVVDMPDAFLLEDGYMLPLMTEYQPDYGKLREAAKSHLDEFIAQHMPDLPDSVRRAVVMGKSFAEIIRYAREQNIDLIVQDNRFGSSHLHACPDRLPTLTAMRSRLPQQLNNTMTMR